MSFVLQYKDTDIIPIYQKKFVVKVGLEPNTVLDGLDNHLTGFGYHPALRPLDYLLVLSELSTHFRGF
jgi:hypothetical protein